MQSPLEIFLRKKKTKYEDEKTKLKNHRSKKNV